MSKVKNLFAAIVILGLLGCAATLPPPRALDPQRSIIGISVTTRAPIRIFTQTAKRVYLIRVDEEEDLFNRQSFIMSNYTKGNQIYILNVKPGRYAAVACYKRQVTPMAPTTEYTTFFSEELIKLTEVTVEPGSIAFMGKYIIDTSVGMKDADDAQLNYFQLIMPDAAGGYLGMAFSMANYYRGYIKEIKRDKKIELEFLTNAQYHLKDTGWEDAIKKRMRDLKVRR